MPTEILIKIIIVILTAVIAISGIIFIPKVNKKTILLAAKKQQSLIIKIIVVIFACSISLLVTNSFTKTIAKDSYIKNFETFIAEVKMEYEEYSKSDWIEIEREYVVFSKEKRLIYEDIFTKEDKKIINRLDGKYSSYKSSASIDNIMKTTKDALDSAVDYLDGFLSNDNE